jgi:hypothetical protein
LLHCNVQPYVVFDGAHDEDDKKLADIRKKCEVRIKDNERAMPQYMECIPVLMYESDGIFVGMVADHTALPLASGLLFQL